MSTCRGPTIAARHRGASMRSWKQARRATTDFVVAALARLLIRATACLIVMAAVPAAARGTAGAGAAAIGAADGGVGVVILLAVIVTKTRAKKKKGAGWIVRQVAAAGVLRAGMGTWAVMTFGRLNTVRATRAAQIQV